jgi:hypothetical protein
MKGRALLIVAAGLLVGADRGKDKEPQLPKGQPPTLVLAKADREGLAIRQMVRVAEYRQEQRTRTVKQNGQDRQVPYQVTVLDQRMEAREMRAGKFQAFGTDGKPVDAKAAAGQLKGWTAVLLSADGKRVDPFYLQVIKEGTLVIVLPQPNSQPSSISPVPPPAQKVPIKPPF